MNALYIHLYLYILNKRIMTHPASNSFHCQTHQSES